MITRRKFLKTAAIAGNLGLIKPINILAARAENKTGYFGVHPFIESHPEAVFIMRTNVDVKTNAQSKKRTGKEFASSVMIPKDETGIPLTHMIAIKPNITGGGGNSVETMGIITDPYFVEGVIEGMKKLGISGSQFYLREVNNSNWERHVYNAMAKRTGAELRNMHDRVSALSNKGLEKWVQSTKTISENDIQWVDVPDGVAFRKIPYLWPINSPGAWILNIAKFKSHTMGLTLCCKNFQGAVANGYQQFCRKPSNFRLLPKEHVNPDWEKIFNTDMKRHINTLPRWDRPPKKDDDPTFVWPDFYDPICQELWSARTLDSLSATRMGLCVVEGIYGHDGDFEHGPNPAGNIDNYKGEAWDYMTNIIIFGMDPLRVDIVGKWLGGHEPGNFGFFHIAMERGMLNVLDPMNIPVYLWENDSAVRKPLMSFERTPLKSSYLQQDYNGGNEPLWHLCNKPFDYSTVPEEKLSYPAKPETRILSQGYPTALYPFVAIEYCLPHEGNVFLEIINDKYEIREVLTNSIKESGYHLAAWNTSKYNSGKYIYRFRFNDFSEIKEIILQKSR